MSAFIYDYDHNAPTLEYLRISSSPILTGFVLANISVIIDINNANNKDDITIKNKFPE